MSSHTAAAGAAAGTASGTAANITGSPAPRNPSQHVAATGPGRNPSFRKCSELPSFYPIDLFPPKHRAKEKKTDAREKKKEKGKEKQEKSPIGDATNESTTNNTTFNLSCVPFGSSPPFPSLLPHLLLTPIPTPNLENLDQEFTREVQKNKRKKYVIAWLNRRVPGKSVPSPGMFQMPKGPGKSSSILCNLNQ